MVIFPFAASDKMAAKDWHDVSEKYHVISVCWLVRKQCVYQVLFPAHARTELACLHACMNGFEATCSACSVTGEYIAAVCGQTWQSCSGHHLGEE